MHENRVGGSGRIHFPITILSIVLFTLILAACAVPFIKPDPKQAIIGEWRTFTGILNDSGTEKIDGISALQFYSDGTLTTRMTLSGSTTTRDGTYKFLDDNHIQLKFDANGDTLLVPFEISGNKLTLKGKDEKEGDTVLMKNNSN